MAAATAMTLRWWSKDTVVVVTGSNKGLGYEIVRGLAKQGLTTVLTARDPARGLSALQTLKAEGPYSVHFHQLDVTDTDSVKKLAAWLQKEFGGLDILINNAAVQKFSQVYEDAQETLETNYFGAKTVTKELLPLLRSSPPGARIVMVSSQNGLLRRFENSYVKSKLRDAQQLNEDIIDSVAAKYLEDVKTGQANEEGWAPNGYQYSESKLLMNAYVRVLAASLSNQPNDHLIFVNSICPGPVDTDMVADYFKKTGVDRSQLQGLVLVTAEEASKPVVSLALLPRDDYPTGKFFTGGREIAF